MIHWRKNTWNKVTSGNCFTWMSKCLENGMFWKIWLSWWFIKFVILSNLFNFLVKPTVCFNVDVYFCLQVIFLIGNKSDLEAQRDVTYEEAKQFADENG